MDDSAATPAILTLIDQLTTHFGMDEARLQEPFEALVVELTGAVDSFLGVQLIIVIDGQPVRLSLFVPELSEEPAQSIATSLQIPLQVLAGADHSIGDGSSITFYAGTPGAFVDLAADLDYALDNALAAGEYRPESELHQPGPDGRVSLDQHLVPVSLVSSVVGLAELSVINMAIGVLIDRGHLPKDAPTELRRRAQAENLSSHAYAASFLHNLVRQHPGQEDDEH